MKKVTVRRCRHLYGGNYGFHCDARRIKLHLTFEHSNGTHIGDCCHFSNCEKYEPEYIETTEV